mgnify:CR=1 FL=1
MKKWLLLLAAGCMFFSTSAYAVDVMKWKPDPEKRFKAKDLNSDGTITKDEFLHPYTWRFNHIDANGDQMISKEELRIHLQDKRPDHVTEKQWSRKSDRHFARKDNNKDNIIAKDEYMHRHEDRFKGYDRDSDGTISREEMRLYWQAEKAKLEDSLKEDDD